MYCCTNIVAVGDVCGPVFFCYAFCISTMSVFYYQAWKQVKVSVVPSRKDGGGPEQSEANSSTGSTLATSPRVAMSPREPGQSVGTGPVAVTVYSGGSRAGSPAMSPTSGSRADRVKRPSKASSVIARRGIAMVLVYYTCWFVLCLIAVFELAGWSSRSLWWDSMGALLAKAQPAFGRGHHAAVLVEGA